MKSVEGSNPPYYKADRNGPKPEVKKSMVVVPSPTKSAIRGQGVEEKQPTLQDIMEQLALLHAKK